MRARCGEVHLGAVVARAAALAKVGGATHGRLHRHRALAQQRPLSAVYHPSPCDRVRGVRRRRAHLALPPEGLGQALPGVDRGKRHLH